MEQLIKLSSFLGDTRIYPGIGLENIPVTYKPISFGKWNERQIPYLEVYNYVYNVNYAIMLLNMMIKPVYKGQFTSTYLNSLIKALNLNHTKEGVQENIWNIIKIFASFNVIWYDGNYINESPLILIIDRRYNQESIIPNLISWTMGKWIKEKYFLKFLPKRR